MARAPATALHRALTMVDASPLVCREDAVLRIVLNNPDRLNAIGHGEHGRLLDVLEDAATDKAVKVVVLSGAGRAFCAGDAIKGQLAEPWPDRLAHRRVDLAIGPGPVLLNAVTAALRSLLKPTVVLMHGYAVGAGYDLASSCDVRIATRDCRIGDPRIKLALWGAEGWSYRLPRLIGQTWVPPITWLGELMTGEEAHDIGLVHLLSDDDRSIEDTARPLIDRLAGTDAAAYRAIKADLLTSLDRSPFSSFQEA